MYRPSYELSASSPSTQETEEMLPAVELQFNYINRDKKRRRYILLDDDPQALQVHIPHSSEIHPSPLTLYLNYYCNLLSLIIIIIIKV